MNTPIHKVADILRSNALIWLVLLALPTTGTLPPPTSGGIWISAAELAKLPMSGSAWNSVKAMADSDCGTPQISDPTSFNDTCVLAKALVFGRTGIESYRIELHRQRGLAIGTELTASHGPGTIGPPPLITEARLGHRILAIS